MLAFLGGPTSGSGPDLILTKPELKIQAIAQKAGNFSPRHFTKLFIEFGFYPSEMREKHEMASPS